MNLSAITAQSLTDNPSKLTPLSLLLQTIEGGTGLGGTHYVFVRGNGTPEENAIELQTAYNTAKTMPRYLGIFYYDQVFSVKKNQTYCNASYGPSELIYYRVLADYEGEEDSLEAKEIITEQEALSVRTTVVVAPGIYKFGVSAFTVDTMSINVVSLTGNADVFITSDQEEPNLSVFIGIHVIATNVYIKGINCGSNAFSLGSTLSIICENCIGAVGSFNNLKDFYPITLNGTFINCTGGGTSFGGGIAGSGDIVNGMFINCTGGNNSFGSDGGIVSGTFINCTGGDGAFGLLGTIDSDAILINCTGSDNSFASGGTASGTFINCEGGGDSFGASSGYASGFFKNCKGKAGAFGGSGGTASGTFINCEGGGDSFGTYAEEAIFRNCIGLAASFGGEQFSATAENCTGGEGSFGGHGDAFGMGAKLYYCRLTSGTFPTPTAGGKLVLCIDGTDSIVTTA